MKDTNSTYLKEKIKEQDKEIKQLKLIIEKLNQELIKEKNKNNNKIIPYNYKYQDQDWETYINILKTTNFV